MTLQTCIFDLGNVLVFFSHDRMVDNIVRVAGTTHDVVRNFLFDSQFQAALETGAITEAQFHAEFEAHANVTVPFEDLKHAVADIFELNADMVPLLSELKSAGMRLVLLSNTCVTHIEFVRSRWDVLDVFDAITTSWEVGALKPDPRIYESALAQANCPAKNCFFTDDIEDYVRQAQSIGIHARVFQNAQTTRHTLQQLGVSLRDERTVE